MDKGLCGGFSDSLFQFTYEHVTEDTCECSPLVAGNSHGDLHQTILFADLMEDGLGAAETTFHHTTDFGRKLLYVEAVNLYKIAKQFFGNPLAQVFDDCGTTAEARMLYGDVSSLSRDVGALDDVGGETVGEFLLLTQIEFGVLRGEIRVSGDGLKTILFLSFRLFLGLAYGRLSFGLLLLELGGGEGGVFHTLAVEFGHDALGSDGSGTEGEGEGAKGDDAAYHDMG